MTDAERLLEEHADGYGFQDFAAAADALAAAGLVPAERADYWKAQDAAARTTRVDFTAPYDEAIQARAIELLEALIVPVHPRVSAEWDPVVWQRYQEALSTLTMIGALSHPRARPWLQRQQETLAPAGGRRGPKPEPEIAFTAGQLSAVPIGPEERLDGMRPTCLELYGDCVIVRFHQLLPAEPEDPVLRREYLKSPFALQDEQGTSYEPAGVPRSHGCEPRQIKGWPEVLVGWQAFVPGAPLDARRFTVTWREQRFAFASA